MNRGIWKLTQTIHDNDADEDEDEEEEEDGDYNKIVWPQSGEGRGRRWGWQVPQ